MGLGARLRGILRVWRSGEEETATNRGRSVQEQNAGRRVLTMLFLVGAALVVGCQSASVTGGGWLPKPAEARWDAVAIHLRGLDVAMVEIGCRYGELYWGGLDQNWGYADCDTLCP